MADPLMSFIELTGADVDVAQAYIEAHNGDAQAAISAFLDSGGAPISVGASRSTGRQAQGKGAKRGTDSSVHASNRARAAVTNAGNDDFDWEAWQRENAASKRGSSSSAPRSTYAGAPLPSATAAAEGGLAAGGQWMDEDGVRAADKHVNDTLVSAGPSVRASAPVLPKGFAQAQGGGGAGKGKRARAGPDYSFLGPPTDLLTPGLFGDALAAARAAGKWLLVNIQLQSEFACLELNRDVWRGSEEVRDLLATGYVLWQQDLYSESEERDPLTGKAVHMRRLNPSVADFLFCYRLHPGPETRGMTLASGQPGVPPVLPAWNCPVDPSILPYDAYPLLALVDGRTRELVWLHRGRVGAAGVAEQLRFYLYEYDLTAEPDRVPKRRVTTSATSGSGAGLVDVTAQCKALWAAGTGAGAGAGAGGVGAGGQGCSDDLHDVELAALGVDASDDPELAAALAASLGAGSSAAGAGPGRERGGGAAKGKGPPLPWASGRVVGARGSASGGTSHVAAGSKRGREKEDMEEEVQVVDLTSPLPLPLAHAHAPVSKMAKGADGQARAVVADREQQQQQQQQQQGEKEEEEEEEYYDFTYEDDDEDEGGGGGARVVAVQASKGGRGAPPPPPPPPLVPPSALGKRGREAEEQGGGGPARKDARQAPPPASASPPRPAAPAAVADHFGPMVPTPSWGTHSGVFSSAVGRAGSIGSLGLGSMSLASPPPPAPAIDGWGAGHGLRVAPDYAGSSSSSSSGSSGSGLCARVQLRLPDGRRCVRAVLPATPLTALYHWAAWETATGHSLAHRYEAGTGAALASSSGGSQDGWDLVRVGMGGGSSWASPSPSLHAPALAGRTIGQEGLGSSVILMVPKRA